MAGLKGIANLPNLLSCFRFIAAPWLLYLAWNGYPRAYVAVLVLSFLSDALDGFLARWFHQESELGAMLDTAADVIIYITIPVSAWWLWPALLRQEAPFVALVIASYSVPALVGLLKFRSLTSYHTWAVKVAAAAAGGAALVMFAGGPTWPFRLATPLCVLAALEQIAITLVLPESWSDVRSLWHVLRQLGSAR
ncbi:MAG: CDP-alcohol phosphatidyltransferase family protein [Gammaproteobacteria bacterium]